MDTSRADARTSGSRTLRGPRAVVRSLRLRLREDADLALLAESALFDPAWYITHYPDVATSGMDPRRHYLRHGASLGRDPGPAFDGQAYRQRYPDVDASGLDPLLHYLRHGRFEGRLPAAVAPARGRTRAAARTPLPVPRTAPARDAPAHAARSTLPPVPLEMPTWSREGECFEIRCAIGDQGMALTVTHQGPPEVLERIEPRVEPFLPIALLAAGAAGRDLVVEGPVDARYVTTLRLSYLPLLRWMFGYPDVDLRLSPSAMTRGAGRFPAASRDPAPAPLLFSAGVDSYFSYIRLRATGHPLDLLVNVNAGGHDTDRACMTRRFERVQAVAQRSGMQAHLIDTNFHEVLRIPHIHAHPIRNITAAQTLYGATDGLVYSTSYAFRDIGLDRARQALDHGGASITSSVAWARMPLIEVGYEAARIEKLRVLAEEPLTYDTLDVCVDGPYQASAGPTDPVNCSRCFKCVRTMLSLELLGRLERYHTQFDLEHFHANRDAFVELIAERGAVLDQELMARLHGGVPDDAPTLQVRPPAWL